MRTTLTLADDVAAAIDELRRSEGIGVSEAVNRLVRQSLVAPAAPSRYEHSTFAMEARMDVTNIGEVLGLLDEEDAPHRGGDGGRRAGEVLSLLDGEDAPHRGGDGGRRAGEVLSLHDGEDAPC